MTENNYHVLVVDTETTGADTNKDSICQLAGVLANPKEGLATPRTMMTTYCKPAAAMTEKAQEVHGITEEHYRYAPPENYALANMDLLLQSLWKGRNVILAGHNHQRFDLPLMDRLYPQAKFQEYPTIDTMILAQRMFPDKDIKLGLLYQWYLDKPAIDAHDAAADCYMVAEILAKMQYDFKMTLEEMAKWSNTPEVWKTMPFGKYKGQPVSRVPKSYFQWMHDNFTDPSPDLEKTILSRIGPDQVMDEKEFPDVPQ